MSEPFIRTRDRLAADLRAVAETQPEAKAAIYRALADRAETGEFDDYGTVHVCGPTALYQELLRHDLRKFAERIANGDYDASREESDEWANSPAGREAMKDFTPEQRAALFGVRDAALTALAAERAKVAKLVEALKVARAHVANNADGWSVSRGAARVDLTIVDAAITEARDE